MTMNHKFSKTAARSIREILQSNSRFKVPRFQRNYSWNTENVETFWSDILDNYMILQHNDGLPTSDTQYLLGSIVLVNNDKNNLYHVIDGQQRLSTLTMLFCVARDIVLEDNKKENITGLPIGLAKITELIENTRVDEHIGWKLELNDTDKSFFREIQEYESDAESQLFRISNKKPNTKSLKYLRANYMLLHKKITDCLHNNFNTEEPINQNDENEDSLRKIRIANQPTLFNFLSYVIDENYMVQIIVDDDSSAFQIFETLNERGQTLSKSNLIKNHILNQISDNEIQKEESDRWNRIFDEIVADNQKDDDFIIESYHSRYGDTSSLRSKIENSKPSVSGKNLYKMIKKLVDSDKTCKQFIEELKKDAAILSGLNVTSKYSDNKSKDDIHAIKLLKAKHIRVPILAAHRKWYDNNSKDYSELVKFLVKFFFKVRSVRQMHPGTIEKMIDEIIKMINGGKTLKEIKSNLMKYDDHPDFMYNFEKKFMVDVNNDAAKYALQQITVCMGTPYDDVKPIDELTLEHILPIKHKDYWKTDEFFVGYDGNEPIDVFVTRLGNLTLLKQAINAKIQNYPFKLKKDITDKDGIKIGYTSSSLAINIQTVCSHDTWTANIILDREKQFLELVDKIWKFDQ